MRHLPNILTGVRLLLAFAFPFAAVSFRVPIVAVALLTEYLDGAISRFYGTTSRLGQLLDPIADKLFFLAVVITFIQEGRLSAGEFVLLGFRDLSVLAAVIWTLARRRYSLMGKMKPIYIGKVVTVFQYLAIFCVLLAGSLNRALFYATAALSFMAAVQYAAAFRRIWEGKMKRIALAVSAVLLGAPAGWSETGAAKILGTLAGSSIAGTVTFTDTKDGLKISARLTGVPAGDHGFHIHQFGSCEDAGTAAGGHYNPASAPHGRFIKSGAAKTHGGDLGNITAKADGTAALDLALPRASLSGGKFAVSGRAVILHFKADDFSQPAGNAGARIACGVIAITAP